MILLPTDQIYYNTRAWFAKNILKSLPNDDQSWYEVYRIWLASQGATIKKFQFTDDQRVVDGLGVAPGYDQFEFAIDENAIIFLLKWS